VNLMLNPLDFDALAHSLRGRADLVEQLRVDLANGLQNTYWAGPNRDRFQDTHDNVQRDMQYLESMLQEAADRAVRISGDVQHELLVLRNIEQRVTSWVHGAVQVGESLFQAGARLLGRTIHDLPAPGSPEWRQVLTDAQARGFTG
jgi:uncharacterized protein YukE